jgi:hypothetical protein
VTGDPLQCRARRVALQLDGYVHPTGTFWVERWFNGR